MLYSSTEILPYLLSDMVQFVPMCLIFAGINILDQICKSYFIISTNCGRIWIWGTSHYAMLLHYATHLTTLHYASTLLFTRLFLHHYASFSATSGTFGNSPRKEQHKKCLCWHCTCQNQPCHAPQIITYVVKGERDETQRSTKVSFGRTIGAVGEKAHLGTLNREEISAVTLILKLKPVNWKAITDGY